MLSIPWKCQPHSEGSQLIVHDPVKSTVHRSVLTLYGIFVFFYGAEKSPVGCWASSHYKFHLPRTFFQNWTFGYQQPAISNALNHKYGSG